MVARKEPHEVEVLLADESCLSKSVLSNRLRKILGKDSKILQNGFSGTSLEGEVLKVNFCEKKNEDVLNNLSSCKFIFYKLNKEEFSEDISDVSDEQVIAATTTMLPHSNLEGLWESLIFEYGVKEKLLRYIQTLIFLNEKEVDKLIISMNNIILLHGPPGTGKTSLCKALAQKATIRLVEESHFSSGALVEINSHSLFSKWFSESGKLVQRMFDEIKKKMEDKNCFVCVLIDEVESLTSARKNLSSGLECSDAVRAVNALLTEIDKIKHRPNVIIMTTSNITNSIDSAFVDRADIKMLVPPPTKNEISLIYKSAITELVNKKILENIPGLDLESELMQACDLSLGLSGRTLRKIPFLTLLSADVNKEVGLDKFIASMKECIRIVVNEKMDLVVP